MKTIKDIARKANVSPATVSRVLNNTVPVNEEKRKKVIKVIQEYKYTPNTVAQSMRTKKSKMIGVVIPDFCNPFYYDLFKYIEVEARKSGYHVIVTSTRDDDDEVQYFDDLIHRSIDGLIVCSYRGDKKMVDYLLDFSKRIPVVFMDNIQLDKPVNSVYINGKNGIKNITKHIINQGHKKIAFIKSIQQYKVANDRYQGYCETLEENGINFNPSFVFEGDYNIESGFNAAKYFFEITKEKPTAVIASTDLMAIGALNYIKLKGFRIPEDIAVAGFDDIFMSKMITPALTTYKQPIEKIAGETIKLLLNKIKKPEIENKRIVLDGELLIRRSTDLKMPEVEKL
jgi:DNA-binding LacI/PurR family transcriptional regulator